MYINRYECMDCKWKEEFKQPSKSSEFGTCKCGGMLKHFASTIRLPTKEERKAEFLPF